MNGIIGINYSDYPLFQESEVKCVTRYNVEAGFTDTDFSDKLKAIAHIVSYLIENPDEECRICEFYECNPESAFGYSEKVKTEDVWFDGHTLIFKEVA